MVLIGIGYREAAAVDRAGRIAVEATVRAASVEADLSIFLLFTIIIIWPAVGREPHPKEDEGEYLERDSGHEETPEPVGLEH
jgi:hypothetical protein